MLVQQVIGAPLVGSSPPRTRAGSSRKLGHALWRRSDNILAFFDYHDSNGATEAINGRLEALRRNAPRIRQPTGMVTATVPLPVRWPSATASDAPPSANSGSTEGAKNQRCR